MSSLYLNPNLSLFLALLFFIPSSSLRADEPPFHVRVVVVKYFPVAGENIDISKTGDWGIGLDRTRRKVDSITTGLVQFLSDASRYHGYNVPDAPPSVVYEVVGTYEFLEPLPTVGLECETNRKSLEARQTVLGPVRGRWTRITSVAAS